jgi:hypothetical protein
MSTPDGSLVDTWRYMLKSVEGFWKTPAHSFSLCFFLRRKYYGGDDGYYSAVEMVAAEDWTQTTDKNQLKVAAEEMTAAMAAAT